MRKPSRIATRLSLICACNCTGATSTAFGSKSNSSAQLALELILEDLEIEQAAEAPGDAGVEDATPARAPRTRKPFPKGLKRVQRTITPSDACTDCGENFKVLGSDVMEELVYVPDHYIVNQIGCPHLASTCCEAVVQAAPSSRALSVPR